MPVTAARRRLLTACDDLLNKEHWLPIGDTIDVGHTRSQTYALLANYAEAVFGEATRP